MSLVNLQNIAAASFLPGLQNSGAVDGQALITGTLPSAGNLIGSFILPLPDPSVVSLMRVNLPHASGDLTNGWFPVMGTVELTNVPNDTEDWTLILYVNSHPSGRQINFNFINAISTAKTFSSYPLNVYAHLFTYPWSTV